MQEAHRPRHIKYSTCCPVPGGGGTPCRGWVFPPWGVPNPALDRGTPIQPWMGGTHPWLGGGTLGYPLSGPGWGTPHSELVSVPPSRLDLAPCPKLDWGTPVKDGGTYLPISGPGWGTLLGVD